ncbi:S-adenosyl-L-methionine-dependent methyltransferase [Massariosphaeria phaeospora]|uniref:S-adenosyl-L-methionine-dependent methyltransferase n=1 Tax=Massariosphaeria phaeospora TaxID=100035 RepID=A0A7C8MDT9_9PLEO|nr:S-adenosyl-L-methionine-dependent methyltransferase [Massariosphaeria phaeospora]
MSLYYEAAAVLTNTANIGGSLKSRIYNHKDLKSSPAQIFALVTEASKWSAVLKDVIEKCGLFAEEKKLTPILALLLTHDLLLSKSGVAASANHVLKLAVSRHRARLGAELTKARIRGGHSTLDAFRAVVDGGHLDRDQATPEHGRRHPRWVRVNTLKTTVAEELSTTFAAYKEASDLGEVLAAPGISKLYFADPTIPNLLALPSKVDLSKTQAYLAGRIILQDKASCFPACLLDPRPDHGDVIDGCAAPGNKATHLAAIISQRSSEQKKDTKVIAFERDKARTVTLAKMVNMASADSIVSIKGGSDFLTAQPDSLEFANVGAILLDPSCSGSGIVGRDDTIKMHLPEAMGAKPKSKPNHSKKRKRNDNAARISDTTLQLVLDDSPPEETPVIDNLSERLSALSTFQLRILTHAMQFPQVQRISYSTCSVYCEENESVVFQALCSSIAQERGWKMLDRGDQMDGLKKWEKRGVWDRGELGAEFEAIAERKEHILDACIRCEKGTADGTMGFFVAAFVRDEHALDIQSKTSGKMEQQATRDDTDEEWNGFSDREDAELNGDRNGNNVETRKKSNAKKRKVRGR